jgi:ribonuclease G
MKENKSEILISSNPFETRVARIEGGRLVEFYVERAKDRGYTGNIYKGKVVRVLPGMQSAFVEVGLARTAFLHVSDIKDNLDEMADEPPSGGRGQSRFQARIQDVLKEGQEIMVQAAKEPMGTKGARITSYISLPGRYLVFMPSYDKVAVSRRISSDRERRRLKELVFKLRPPGFGFIVRTVCEGMSHEEIKSDMDFLVKLWSKIQGNMSTVQCPGLLYEELDLALRTVRDVFSVDVDRLVIESKEEYDRVSAFVAEFLPGLAGRVKLYDSKEDIFDAYGIEIELIGALDKKVWLRSGGHIVIDQMEALTAIDVNTGKFVGKKNSDHTIFKTNMEAVHEAVYQLKLRNIGGIIVIDFIDMSRISDREKVYNELREALKADKARTNILKISELGIVEMTRKRVRESLSQALCGPCPYCEGNALVRGVDTIAMDIYRELLREMPSRRKGATVCVSPYVARKLEEDPLLIEDVEKRFGKKVTVRSIERFHQERYEIT